MVNIWDRIIDETEIERAGNVISWDTAKLETNLTIIDLEEDIINGKPYFEPLSIPMNFYDGKDNCEEQNMDIAVAANLDIIQAQS